YPQAKYIHIVRDPRKLFPSTMKLWNSLDEHQALQAPTDQVALQSFVLESLKTMYGAFERDRLNIPSGQIIDVHYEQFIAKPVESLMGIYEHLGLGDPESMRVAWESKAAQEQGYQTNKLQINREEESMILEHWGQYARRYGYLES
ncbi:MAG: sulfotransferase family protein, partial [Pirellula sp.]